MRKILACVNMRARSEYKNGSDGHFNWSIKCKFNSQNNIMDILIYVTTIDGQ